jgi:hypothetical protein
MADIHALPSMAESDPKADGDPLFIKRVLNLGLLPAIEAAIAKETQYQSREGGGVLSRP